MLCIPFATTVCGQNDTEEPFGPGSLQTALPDVLSQGTLQPKARLWFSDRDGNMVLAPEEFAEDYFGSRGKSPAAGNGLPAASLQRVELDVSIAADDFARVTGRFATDLVDDYATTINLALGSVQWSQWSFTGPASQNRLLPQRDEPSWRWIVQGEANSTHTATLEGVTRVELQQQRRSVRFSLPTAPCVLSIRLPENAVDLRVRSEDVMQKQQTEQGTIYRVTSSGGGFSLSWRDQEQLPQVAVVNATSNTRFEIVDPTQPWLATTTLNLRWDGRDASSRIKIALPSGGRWRAVPSSDLERYRIISDRSALPAVSASTTAEQAQLELESLPLLLENFDVARNDSVEVELEWEWLPDIASDDSAETTVQLVAPILDGVDEHSGTLDCVVTSAYAVVYHENGGAQLFHQGPLLDTYPRQQLQFRFNRQNFDLSLVFRREQSLPTVRPTYWVHIDRNKITMTMWFDCSFETNQSQMELGLVLDEWVIQENTARVVNSAEEPFSADGEVLRVQQQVDRNYVIRSTGTDNSNFAASRHIDQIWRVVAERTWQPDDKALYFQIPQIIRGQVNDNPEVNHGSGALLVSSDSNVLLTWQELAGSGLQRDSFSTEYQRFVRQNSVRKPLVYRFQSSETTPQWGGKVETLARQVSVQHHADLEVNSAQIAIRQEFDVQVANEPLEQLRFAVRKDAADNQPPQVLINGLLVSSPLVATLDSHELDALLQPQPVAEPVVPPPAAAVASAVASTDGVPTPTTQATERPPRPTAGASDSARATTDSPEAVTAPSVARRSDVSSESATPSVARRSDVSSESATPSVARRSDVVNQSATPENPEAVTAATSSPAALPTTVSQWQVYEVLGAPEWIGASLITIQTSTIWSGSKIDDSATDVQVPLVQLLLPQGTQRLPQDWSLRTDLQVETLVKSDGVTAAESPHSGPRLRPLGAKQQQIELKLYPRRLQGAGLVRIDKCWLQSFVSGSKRRERFVVHVESHVDELRLKLPRDAIIREGTVKVSVDGFGEKLYGYDQQTDIVTIPLGLGRDNGHVVEVSYFLPGELSWVTAIPVSPPQILGAEQIDHFYWQLLTPAVQHLGWSPKQLTAEWTWQWSGLWWKRSGRLNQRLLEEWIATVPQDPPPASANSYVMSAQGMLGTGTQGSAQAWALSRFILWFPVGLMAIGLAFVALNFAVVRQPAFLLLLALMIAGLATLWPDLAVLAGQTAVISLGLVALVWVVQAGVDSRVRRRSVFAARSSTYIDRSDQYSVSRGQRPNIPLPPAIGSSAGTNGG